jgi:hypothetical protein
MGKANRDIATGFRYGVISQHSVLQAWADSAEADYGKPTCPKCGDELADSACGESLDYYCADCDYEFDSDEAFGDEPIGWHYSGDGYELTDCLNSDIFVLKSPYYTTANFCSPCVPGAGNLDNANPDGAETYCLGHDWFESGEAPYPVFSVETRQRVYAAS